jgi:hypothetical protein
MAGIRAQRPHRALPERRAADRRLALRHPTALDVCNNEHRVEHEASGSCASEKDQRSGIKLLQSCGRAHVGYLLAVAVQEVRPEHPRVSVLAGSVRSGPNPVRIVDDRRQIPGRFPAVYDSRWRLKFSPEEESLLGGDRTGDGGCPAGSHQVLPFVPRPGVPVHTFTRRGMLTAGMRKVDHLGRRDHGIFCPPHGLHSRCA